MSCKAKASWPPTPGLPTKLDNASKEKNNGVNLDIKARWLSRGGDEAVTGGGSLTTSFLPMARW
jgi:hypothetical protein